MRIEIIVRDGYCSDRFLALLERAFADAYGWEYRPLLTDDVIREMTAG